MQLLGRSKFTIRFWMSYVLSLINSILAFSVSLTAAFLLNFSHCVRIALVPCLYLAWSLRPTLLASLLVQSIRFGELIECAHSIYRTSCIERFVVRITRHPGRSSGKALWAVAFDVRSIHGEAKVGFLAFIRRGGLKAPRRNTAWHAATQLCSHSFWSAKPSL